MTRRYIIAPYAMHKNLLNFFRQTDSFADIKTIDKRDFLASFFSEINTQAIKEIMIEENVSDDVAKKIVQLLPFIDKNYSIDKLKNLFRIKEKMDGLGLIKKDPYLSMLFKGKSVDVYGYSILDKELINPLISLGCQINIHSSELIRNNQTLKQFPTIYEEVLSCLNKISSLLDSGVNSKDIYIYCSDTNYLYYLNRFQTDFHFHINIPLFRNLYSQNFVCDFLKNYHQNKNLKKASESISQMSISEENKILLNDVINEVFDERFSFEAQYQYLLSSLKNHQIPDDIYHPSICFISEPIMVKNSHVFVLGFREGLFPTSYQDSDYLTDQEKGIISLNTSLEKGKISSQVLTSFFAQENYYYFSYSERYATNHYYPSPFAKIWGMEIVEAHLPETYYSKTYAEMILATLCDSNKFYQEKNEDFYALKELVSIPYDSYDNNFTGARVFDDSMLLKHSYSKMKTYYACPFQYYASFGLKLDPFSGNFSTALGTVAHHIFQDMYQDHFDFEKSYQAALNNNDYQFTEEEQVLLIQLKADIKVAVEAIQLHNSKMEKAQVFTEKFLSISIDKNTTVEGIIDKIIITNNQHMFLLDYKTGKETFTPSLVEYGSSFQLPTYAFLTSQSPQFKDYSLSGLFIHHIIPDSIGREEKEDALIPNYLKLDGYVIDNIDVIRSFDGTFGIPGEESAFIKSLKLTKNNQFYKYSHVQTKDYFKSLSDMALQLFIEGNRNIRQNIFSVRPQFLDQDGPCKRCPFKDICYVKYEQKVFPKEIKQEEIEDSGI